MSDTPRTDAENVRTGWPAFYYNFARTLERELAEALARIAALEANQCEDEPVCWHDPHNNVFSDEPGSLTESIPLYRKKNHEH